MAARLFFGSLGSASFLMDCRQNSRDWRSVTLLTARSARQGVAVQSSRVVPLPGMPLARRSWDK